MDLSIILINHNTAKLTKQTVMSALDTISKTEYEIVVVDNSSDRSEVFTCDHERVKVFSGIANKGFGDACNYGTKKSCGEYLLFLNSDTILEKNTVDEAFAYIYNHDDIGTIGVRQLLPDGKLDHGCKRGFPSPMSSLYYFAGMDKRFPNSKKFGSYRQTFVDEKEIADVDCISGAFMMLSRGVFDLVGGFDTDYFMYGEDVDLCYRIKQKGYRNVYYGKCSFTHLKGQSGIDDPKVLKYFYESMRLFYDKHYKDIYNPAVNFLVHCAIDLKYSKAKKELEKETNPI